MTPTTTVTTPSQVLAELGEVQRQLDACAEESEANYRRRLALWQRGRELGLTVREMAEATPGVREGAIGQALHKARKRES